MMHGQQNIKVFISLFVCVCVSVCVRAGAGVGAGVGVGVCVCVFGCSACPFFFVAMTQETSHKRFLWPIIFTLFSP
jgi:hypothetical protein